MGANTGPVGWGDAQQAQVGGSAVGRVGAGATKLSGQEPNDPPGAGVPTSRPSTDAEKGGTERRSANYWLRQLPVTGKRYDRLRDPGPDNPRPHCRLPGSLSA